MINSINTNTAAMIGVQSLNAASQSVQTTENQISTGEAVSGPTDNGATWAIAQGIRAQVSGWQAVSNSLNTGQSIVDTALSGAQQISDLLTQIQADALSYSGATDAESQTAYQNGIENLISQIDDVANASSFGGQNLISTANASLEFNNPSGVGGGVELSVDTDAPINAHVSNSSDSDSEIIEFNYPYNDGYGPGDSVYTGRPETDIVSPDGAAFSPETDTSVVVSKYVKVVNSTSGGALNINPQPMTASVLGLDGLDWSNPKSILDQVGAAQSYVSQATEYLGGVSDTITNSSNFATKVQNTLTTGVSNLVDADMAVESANLQADQTKQQLAAQSLSIANGNSSVLLSLFNKG